MKYTLRIENDGEWENIYTGASRSRLNYRLAQKNGDKYYLRVKYGKCLDVNGNEFVSENSVECVTKAELSQMFAVFTEKDLIEMLTP